MAIKTDWHVSVGRQFAEDIAIDYGFDDKRRAESRAFFDAKIRAEIGRCVMKATKFGDMDSLRYDMERVLGWKYGGTVGWRKAEGYGKEGKKGEKLASPDVADLAIYAAIERLWPIIKTDKLHIVATVGALQAIADFIGKVQSGRGDDDILDRGRIDSREVGCLRYMFAHPHLMRPGLNPTRALLDHIKSHVGVHFHGKSDKMMMSDLQILAGEWFEPWALMELALPYPWIGWGYYPNEKKHE